jgi:hypothetical protein
MKNIIIITIAAIFSLTAETLFEVKDSSNRKVLDVSTDGLRILNNGDTLMVISPAGVRVNLDNSADKALSRTFAVTTTASKNKGLYRVLEVGTESTTMREGDTGHQYTDFSPENIFIGLNSGINTYFSLGYGGQELGVNNIFLGNNSGVQNTQGFGNIFIGNLAGYNNNSGFSNMFIGNNSGEANTDGYANLFIGDSSGMANTTGDRNTFVGYHSGMSNISGYANTAFGNGSGFGNESGMHNSVFGYEAGQYNDSGSYNSYFGSGSGESNTAGSNNSIFGYEAGNGDISYTFNNNSFFGSKSGFSIRTGSNNTYLGYQSGYSNVTGSGGLFLGYMAGYSETLANKLYIANSNTSTPLIKGTFPNTDLTITANTATVAHATGTSYGLYITNKDYTNKWHFYQYAAGRLGLFYNGSYRGEWNVDTGAYTFTSDRRLKKNIGDLGRVSEKIAKIEPKTYNYIGQSDKGKKYTGLIAQDVAEIFPEFVSYNEEEDIYTIDYAGLSVIALQGLKEQKNEIDELKKEMDELKKIIKR